MGALLFLFLSRVFAEREREREKWERLVLFIANIFVRADLFDCVHNRSASGCQPQHEGSKCILELSVFRAEKK